MFAHDDHLRKGIETCKALGSHKDFDRFVVAGGTAVELLTYEGVPVEAASQKLQPGYRMMALEGDDMRKTLEDLKAKGIEPVWDPIFRDRYARAEIRDPNGYHIELR
jgi:hypothetical protein